MTLEIGQLVKVRLAMRDLNNSYLYSFGVFLEYTNITFGVCKVYIYAGMGKGLTRDIYKEYIEPLTTD